jgi:CelD/BcsL family acetyltransferase involved in cellulose biosynthesis
MAEGWAVRWSATRPRPPMQEYRWVRTWWEIHRDDGELLLILVKDGQDQPVGLAPLYLRREVPLHTVHFLGTGEREADEVTGEYLGVLAAPAMVGPVTARVALALREAAPRWDRLHLVNLSATQELAWRLPQELGATARCIEVDHRPAYRIAVQPLDAYLAALPSANFRHRCRRALRAGAAAGVELVTATEPERARQMMAALIELHQQRWRERGRPGAFGSAVFRDFHQRLLPGYLADGSGWLAGLRQGDRWLAVRYHLRAGDRVFDYLSGVDTAAPSALGPGLLLTLHALDWCARNGVRTYDLLGGDYDYKRRLATEVDQLVAIDVFGDSLAAQLWLAARRLRERLRPAADAAAPR